MSVPAGATTTLDDAAVMRPLPLTVNDGMEVVDPKLPVLEFTMASVVAMLPVPLPVTSPVSVMVGAAVRHDGHENTMLGLIEFARRPWAAVYRRKPRH